MADETDDIYVAATRVLWAPYVDKFPHGQHEYFVQSYAANADYRRLIDFARQAGRDEAAAAANERLAREHGNGLVTYPARKSTAPPPPSTTE